MAPSSMGLASVQAEAVGTALIFRNNSDCVVWEIAGIGADDEGFP